MTNHRRKCNTTKYQHSDLSKERSKISRFISTEDSKYKIQTKKQVKKNTEQTEIDEF